MRPKHSITAAKAINLLRDGVLLLDSYISGELKIETGETWDKTVILENCVLENFSGAVTQFNQPVRLINCHFKKCQFAFTYFLSGLVIDNCLFDNYLDLQAGGHNKAGKSIIIKNNYFAGFVNFFDCWYESEVIIIENHFQKGTNLLGKPHNIPVSFDVKPTIHGNLGQLDSDQEE